METIFVNITNYLKNPWMCQNSKVTLMKFAFWRELLVPIKNTGFTKGLPFGESSRAELSKVISEQSLGSGASR